METISNLNSLLKPNTYKENPTRIISSKSVDALREYFINSGSFTICKKLRENKPLTHKEKNIADEIDLLFYTNAKTACDNFTAYRGITCSLDELLNSDKDRFIDKGFVSVTTNKEVAKNYSSNIGTLLEIEIPKGEKYIDYSDFKKFDRIFKENGNHELLLPRNSGFELISYDRINNVAHLKYTGQKTPPPRLLTEIESPTYPNNYYLKTDFKNRQF